ncbi:MAG TPA: hypothetical protein VH062_05965 [Polyangiaceae bacterium]|nr:hypothetical protein [Polyangiaceae bacterium]
MRALAILPLVLGAFYTLGLLVFSAQVGTFIGDDLSTFYALVTEPFGRYLTALLGGQLVVLHRLVTYVLYRLAPMSFTPAVVVLVVFHLTAAFYLYRTLETMRRSLVNAFLVAWYLMTVFVGIQLTWWSSGLTRMGYIAFGAIAIYHYVRHLRLGENRDLVVTFVAGLLAFGFYAMAVLLPSYCFAVALVSGIDTRSQSREKRLLRLCTLLALLACGAVYSSVSWRLLPPALRRTNADVAFQLTFLRACFRVFVGSLADRALRLGASAPVWFVAVLSTFVVYSSVRSRRALFAWALGLLLVALNFLVVGTSSRTLIWPTETVVEYRHYFELCFFIVLLGGAVFHSLADTPEGRALAARAPLPAFVLAVVVLVLHGYSSALTFRSLLRRTQPYSSIPSSRNYLTNLSSDLRALAARGGDTPTFTEGFFPPELDLLDFSFRHYSQLFQVLQSKALFVADEDAEYTVDVNGHVVSARSQNVVP